MSGRGVKLLVLDVDGVMTDGSILLDDHGRETKRFHVRDGLGVKLAMTNGIAIAIATARVSRATTHRAKELGIAHVEQAATDKRRAMEHLCRRLGVELRDAAYLGDDLPDLPALAIAGYPMAVADAADEVKAAAKHVTLARGGRGAVREAVEHLLKADGRWEQAIASYRR